MSLSIAIPNEASGPERRVALTPDAVKKLVKTGFYEKIAVAAGAGWAAGFPDTAYTEAGAVVLPAGKLPAVDVLLRVTPPSGKEKLPLKPDGLLVTLTSGAPTWPQLGKLAPNVLALERLPRTSRAQAMDVLSSQANLGGYAAALAVARHLPRLMPPLMTAAGSSKPANVLVLGVGVAGLQAIATARRLGATVHAFDVRPEVSEQIRSLGAKVVEVEGPTAEGKGGYAGALDDTGMKLLQEKLAPFIAAADGVITTAQVPGRAAPVLVSAKAVGQMRPGSVIVDMSAGGFNKANGVHGGNCPLTVADEVTITENGVTLVGETNWPSTLAADASRFWSQNMVNLLAVLVDKQGNLTLEDELARAMHIIRKGEVSA